MHSRLLDRWNAISLRTKITGVTVLMLTLGLLVTGIGTMAMLKPVLLEQLDAQLSAASGANYVNAYLYPSPSDKDKIATDASPSDYFAALYDSNGKLVKTNWTNIPFAHRPAVPESLTLAKAKAMPVGGYSLSSNDGRTSYRALVTTQTFAGTGELATVIVATTTSQIDTVMAAFLAIFLLFGVIVIIVGAGLTRMLVTTTFAPLREVEQTAAAIADGDFSQRLGGATPNTEVGRLNRSLNTMLNRIDRAFNDRARTIDQMRRFVGDASHELRTPLVSVRGYAELYRMGALQTPEDVAQAMDRIEKEAIRMGLLVEDLLELARLDETKPLDLHPVDLVRIARDAAMDAMAGSPAASSPCSRRARCGLPCRRWPRNRRSPAWTPSRTRSPTRSGRPTPPDRSRSPGRPWRASAAAAAVAVAPPARSRWRRPSGSRSPRRRPSPRSSWRRRTSSARSSPT